MDHQAHLASAIVNRRRHRIDQKRHVVVDDLDDGVRRRPAVGVPIGIVDPHLRGAVRAALGEAPQRHCRPEQVARAARRDVGGRHVLVKLGDEPAQQTALGNVRNGLG